MIYTIESDAVRAYKNIFPDTTDEVAIGSVNTMREEIEAGKEPATGATDISEIIRIIKADILAEADTK